MIHQIRCHVRGGPYLVEFEDGLKVTLNDTVGECQFAAHRDEIKNIEPDVSQLSDVWWGQSNSVDQYPRIERFEPADAGQYRVICSRGARAMITAHELASLLHICRRGLAPAL